MIVIASPHALGQALGACARREEAPVRVGRPFFKQVGEILDTPWALAAVLDFVFPSTVGERPANLETSLSFAVALTHAAARRADIHKLAAEVQH